MILFLIRSNADDSAQTFLSKSSCLMLIYLFTRVIISLSILPLNCVRKESFSLN